jgi:hypothetical protein
MHVMRAWMRLVETRAGTVRVFHGSPEASIRLAAEPLYGVRDFGFAASYATDRGHGTGFVHTFDFHFDNLCDAASLQTLFDAHGIEPWPSAAGVFINNPEFLPILTEAGYDGLTAHDFGFRSDFEELPVWMVVNAARQARHVAVVSATKDDLRHSHAP